MPNEHANQHAHQNLHKKEHKNSKGEALPHLKDAANPDTGKVDTTTLLAGADAWKHAIESGDYELVSAIEVGVDDVTDVLVLTRRKLK